MSAVENMRKMPRQSRARDTVEVVLEAAAQVLEMSGEAGFNTNAVAERAGVSIGALYRYIPDKAAILRALALRETAAHRDAVLANHLQPQACHSCSTAGGDRGSTHDRSIGGRAEGDVGRRGRHGRISPRVNPSDFRRRLRRDVRGHR